uniref:Uncharacterized protein n=1 Tax=Ditylum brightwellii TaxID=49249 RepID=A0A7S4QJE8_9STRA
MPLDSSSNSGITYPLASSSSSSPSTHRISFSANSVSRWSCQTEEEGRKNEKRIYKSSPPPKKRKYVPSHFITTTTTPYDTSVGMNFNTYENVAKSMPYSSPSLKTRNEHGNYACRHSNITSSVRIVTGEEEALSPSSSHLFMRNMERSYNSSSCNDVKREANHWSSSMLRHNHHLDDAMLDDGNNTSIGALSQTLEGKKSLAHTKTKVIKNTELAWNNHIYPSATTKYSSQHDHFQPSRQLRTATHSDYSVYSTTPFTTVSMPHSYSFHSENCHYLSYVPKQKKQSQHSTQHMHSQHQQSESTKSLRPHTNGTKNYKQKNLLHTSIPTATDPNQSKKNHSKTPDELLLYMGTTLKRTQQHQKWGLSLTLGNQYLIVGDVDVHLATRNTSWSLFCSSTYDPPDIPLNNEKIEDSKEYEEIFQNLFRYHASLHPPPPSSCYSNSEHVHVPYIQKGDIILNVNGISTSAFVDLKSVSTYMTSSNALHMIILRHVDILLHVPSSLLPSSSRLLPSKGKGIAEKSTIPKKEGGMMMMMMDSKTATTASFITKEGMQANRRNDVDMNMVQNRFTNSYTKNPSTFPSNYATAALSSHLYPTPPPYSLSKYHHYYSNQLNQQKRDVYNTTTTPNIIASSTSTHHNSNTFSSEKTTFKKQQPNKFDPISFQVHYETSDRRILANPLFYDCGCRTDLVLVNDDNKNMRKNTKMDKKRLIERCNSACDNCSSMRSGSSASKFLLYSDNEDYDPDEGIRANQVSI